MDRQFDAWVAFTRLRVREGFAVVGEGLGITFLRAGEPSPRAQHGDDPCNVAGIRQHHLGLTQAVLGFAQRAASARDLTHPQVQATGERTIAGAVLQTLHVPGHGALRVAA